MCRTDTILRGVLFGLALLLLCPPLVQAQEAPAVAVAWQPGGSALVEWQGLPAGACVEKAGIRITDTCTAAGRLLLPAGGTDTAYAPRGGETYIAVLSGVRYAQAMLPRVEVWLPILVAP